ncbi:MAG: GGDEF domain-containing protein, partial [Geobacteraceae bacterium]|nr:GGDEF domain-containing protein [Geobacteraceae bacterium]
MDHRNRPDSVMGPGTCNNSGKRLFHSCSLIIFGTGISLAVWLIHSVVDFLISADGRDNFIGGVFTADLREVWSRLLITIIIMAFSIYAQFTLNKRKQAEASLSKSHRFSKRILDSMNDAVSIINVSDYRLVMVNSVFLDELGIEEQQALGRTCYEVTHALSESCCHEDHPCPLLETVVTGNFSQAHHVHLGREGVRRDVEISVSPVRDESGKIVQVVHVSRDITERKRAEREIQQLAYYDTLTGLPNRMLFSEHLKQALAQAERAEQRLALLFLDLDRFKEVNDTLGHSIGDRLLKVAAERLGHCLRKNDTVARLGGDEFVIVISALSHAEDVAVIARKILDALMKPILLETHEIVSTGSIGISVYPKDGKDVDSLLRNADMAMYRAKEQGR